MNRYSRFNRRRGGGGNGAHRVVSATLVLVLIALTASAAVIGRAPGASAQASTPVTASVAPETTLFYVAIDLDTSSAQYQKSTELLQRLGVDTSVESLVGDMSSEVTGGNATEAAQFAALLGGEAGIAVFDFGSDLSSISTAVEGDLGVTGVGTPEASAEGATTAASTAVIISAPNPDAAFTAAETALQKDATDRGATVSEETYEGVQIKTLPADESSGATGDALARVGDFVVFGSAVDDLKPVIDTQTGKTPSLGDSADFKKVAGELNSDWLLFGHVNGDEMAKQLSAAAESGVDVSAINMAQLQADSGFVVWADDPGFRFDSITLPAADGSAAVAANFDPELPSKVPGDAIFLADGADLGKTGFLDAVVLAALGSLTGSVGVAATPDPSKTPEELAQEQFAQLELLLGFNIKTDFIDQLVGEWGIAAWGFDVDAMSSQDFSGVHFLMVSDAQTPATVSDAVSKLSLLLQAGLSGQGTITTKLIGQDQLNVLTIPSQSGGTPVTIEYGVLGGKFILSLNDAISDYAEASGSKLADNPNYQSALSALPADHNGVFYLDLTQIVPIAQASLAASTASLTTVDASEKCATYSTQAAAQEAFDADPSTNWELDQDFDGQACEDFFNPSTPEADASPEASQLTALKSLTAVAFERDGMSGVSALLVIQQ